MKNQEKNIKILEFIPLIAFFIIYKLYDLISATIAIITSTVIVTCFIYIKYKIKPSKMVIASTFIMSIMGGISIYTNDTTFIKMKPTILYCICALTITIGMLFKKLFVKLALGHILKLTDKQWINISWQWIVLFMSSALMNEIIWRTFSEQAWVYLKVVMMPVLFLVFMGAQIYCYRKYICSEIATK